MVGRDAPLRALVEALDAAAQGRPSLAVVSGEAGIGKTRLVTEVESVAVERGFLVLHGESVEFGGDELAYAPLVAALRDAPLALDDLPSEARGVLAAVLPHETPGAGAPGRLFELLLDLLGATAKERPVLLVLEDVHWADRLTLAWLAFLARNLRAERILGLATYRVDDELSPGLRRLGQELARHRSVVRVELEPLTPADVARQLEAIAGGPVSAALAGELHARAGGNPFFVEELFAAGDEIPGTLREVLLTRVARVPAAPLDVLAAAGGRGSHALLERLGAEADGVRAGLDAGLLVADREGVAVRHGLISEVVYDRLLPGERSALHRQIAAALHDAPAAQRAHHYHRSGLRAEALAASVAAGNEAAAVQAYPTALVHFERALELWDPSVDRVELLASAAQAARHAGDAERAVTLCREAISLTEDPGRQAQLYERLGEYQFWDDEAALEAYEHALALAPGEPRLLAARGHALMGLRRWEEARACSEAALEAGAWPRITLGVVLAFLGDPEAAEAHLRQALELAQTGEETARAYLHLGELLRVRGDHAGALAAMVDGERAAARLGLRGSFGHFMYVNGADDLLRLGRWEEAAARLDEAARMDLSRTAAALRSATAGQLHGLRGQLDAARRELAAATDVELPSEFLAPLAVARATVALAGGDPAAAGAFVDTGLAGVQDPVYSPPLYSLGLRAEAERAEADPARADRLLAGLDALLAGPGPPPDALAHRSLAVAERSRVAREPAPERWDAAAAAFEALGEPYPAAYARLREAEAILLAGGPRAGAARALATAQASAVALGARPLEAEVEALARRARLEPQPVAAAPPPAADDAGLTAREADVLRLLADGLTNREIAQRLFISEKTVGAHLAHIYAKLDVHSRVEAAGRAQRLGILDRPA